MKTPLYDAHVALGARMAPFGGWDMPIQYDGILIEHEHTRTRTGLFDICHMGEFELRGPTALADLERLLTQSIGSLAVGQCRYGYLLRDDGGVLDDLTCYRLGTDHFWLVVNAGTCADDAAWIRSHLSPQTQFTDLSPQIAKLDIQGPTSQKDMEAVIGKPLPDLKYFRFTEWELWGEKCLLSRTGYTGEWGYELYFPWGKAVAFWEKFLTNKNIKPVGLGARDTLRLEMGYPLYGHELSTDRSPVATGRGNFIDAKKNFIGKSAVEKDLKQGAGRYLVGLRLENRRAARSHDQVFSGDKLVGEVTSGSLAPSLNVAVAMAFIDEPLTQVGTSVEIEVHGKRLPALVVDLPFYKKGTARKT
jgi:aminomethyltransferase